MIRPTEPITDAKSAATLFGRRVTLCDRWDVPLPFRERFLMSLAWRPEYQVPAWRVGSWLYVVDPLFFERVQLHMNSDRAELRERLNVMCQGSNLPR